VLYESLFVIINLIVAPVWLMMLLAPRWRVTEWVVRGAWASLAVAAIYLAVIVTHVGMTDGHFFSLEGVSRLWTHRGIVLAGWAHYLCLDLVLGSWIFRDASRTGVAHSMVVPCLLATLMYGPVGLLLYFAVRSYKTRTLTLLS
jgi:hypothetical protein